MKNIFDGFLFQGSVWTFRARGNVQYDYPDHPENYCYYTVFQCAFVTLFISYGFLAATICSSRKT